MRDESTAEVRIVLELKKGADPQLVMAYLFKHTPLAINVQVNLTCLVRRARASRREVGRAPSASRSPRCCGTSSTSASRR